jgi:hypothetical protein
MKWTLIALWGLMLLLGYTNPVLSGLLFFHRRHLGRADSFSHTIVRTISPESQQIAAWKLLYRVQHPARYVSRLQTIPSSDIELEFTHDRQ